MERLMKVLREQAERYALLEEQVALEALRRSGRRADPALMLARIDIVGQARSGQLLADLRSLPPDLADRARLAAAAGAPLALSFERFELLRQSARPLPPDEACFAPLARFRLLPALNAEDPPAAPSAPARSSSST